MTMRRLAMAFLACSVILVAGCAATPPGASPSLATQGTATAGPATAGQPAETKPPASAAGPTADPTAVPESRPPAAMLAVDGGPAVPGVEGSYTWDGFGSDAPWIVPPVAAAVTGPGPYLVTLDPALPVATWEASWAKVTSGTPATPGEGSSGTGSDITVAPPSVAGAWGLQVHASFGAGRNAVWYWRVRVTR